MNKQGRTGNSIKNIITALAGQVFSLLMVFISRRIFLNFLSAEYLGINGLFTNVLTMLSLAELGMGSAIIYSLYKPIAENDIKKINALMNFYKRAFTVIGLVVLAIGLAIFPFLDLIIKDKPDIPNVNMYFLLFLADSVITYFYAYKRSIIIANQKQYIVTLYRNVFTILLKVVQIVVLVATGNFLLYLLSKTVLTIIENVVIANKANRLYPEVTYDKNDKVDSETKSELVKNTKAMLLHKLGTIVVNGTDNILISSLIGIYWVGLYSNYMLLIAALSEIVTQVFASITASVGNLSATDEKSRNHDVYKAILFINFWLISFCSIGLFTVINNFISLWLGSEYLLDIYLVFILVSNFYLSGIRRTTSVFKDAMGLFYHDRFKPLAESVVNLVASIVLAKYYGIVGIFLGTLISTLTTCFWIEPYVLYKHGFKTGVKEYFILFAKYTFVGIMAGLITWYLCSLITAVTWGSLMVKVVICVIVPNVIFVLLFHKTREFRYFYNMFSNLIMKKLKKRAQ